MTREDIREAIKQTIIEAQNQELLPRFDLPEISVERQAQEKFGDYSSSIALKIAPLVKKSPAEVAQILLFRLKEKLLFATIEIAPPGFINFYLIKEYLHEQVEEILEEKQDYGWLDLGQGQKVQMEFISANPTGPLTLGNGRSGFCGDTLANVLVKAGFSVQREYLINDAGFQIETLGHSILNDDKAQYKGDYIEQLRKEKNLKDALRIVESDLSPKKLGEMGAGIIFLSMIKPTIENRMKIKFDNWFSEKALRESGALEKMLGLLKEKKATYEKEGALWFKSSEFGDDKDRVLVTSGQTEKGVEGTYLLQDIAYHYDKFVGRKFDSVIDILGADHHGYIARLQAAGKALGAWNQQRLKIIIMQLVRLFKDGKEIRMSKRAGTYVTIDELLDEIPLDVARFFFLMYSADTHMDFNLDLAKEQSEKNPVYYVQYAYARICSILVKAGAADGILDFDGEVLKKLDEPMDFALIKQLMRFPEIVVDTARDYQVQRLPQYALDLVRIFHRFYEECRVIGEDEDLTKARLALVTAVKIILKATLDLMGISAPEKM